MDWKNKVVLITGGTGSFGKKFTKILLAEKNPQKVIGHLCKPLFSPTQEYEKEGDVSNVVFPTATSIFGDRLYIYYGAADKRIAVASVSLSELLDELSHNVCTIENEEIGLTAGHVYQAALKGTTLKQLKKLLRKDEKLLTLAIGWLAKEGKVRCSYTEKDIEIIAID